jgi:thermostable 8-oxoguanine DNA glycosylase
MKDILEYNNIPYEPFVEFEEKYKIDKHLPFCIAWADSDMGRMLKSTNNIGNV